MRRVPCRGTGDLAHLAAGYNSTAGRDMGGTQAAPMRVLGLMSGTSMDGIDIAFVETDGERHADCGAALTVPYATELRERLRGVLGGKGAVAEVERLLTLAHAEAVEAFLAEAGLARRSIDLIGFHGHTILHEPEQGRTWQIGDGALLAEATGIDVVHDFRSQDMASGGQGAPLAPLYHAALGSSLERPLAVLNVGGVANVTWIGANGALLAFDTGPGNAPLDDWCRRTTGQPRDEGGRLAAAGHVREDRLAQLLDHPYFRLPPPKSLDRDAFDLSPVASLAPADGAATLTAFTAAAVARARDHFPEPVRRWLVCGGGRHNPSVMSALRRALGAEVAPVEAVGWDGDALEAQAFAYLAVRSLRGQPLSVPTTTGVRRPTTGGRLHPAPRRARRPA
jgi:anhydro-N-acetylmuramic acid kinase